MPKNRDWLLTLAVFVLIGVLGYTIVILEVDAVKCLADPIKFYYNYSKGLTCQCYNNTYPDIIFGNVNIPFTPIP